MNKKILAVLLFLSLFLLGCEMEETPERPVREIEEPVFPSPDRPLRDPAAPPLEREDEIENDRPSFEPLNERADEAIRRFEEETRDLIDRR